MAKVKVALLTPGALLESEVRGQDGQLLAPFGAPLESRHIRQLREAGVEEVLIKDPTLDVQEEISSRQSARFKLVDLSRPEAAELLRICVERAKQPGQRKARLESRELPLSPEITAPPTPEEVLEADSQLASLPDVLIRINKVLSNPNSTAQESSEVIAKDPGLSAKLLKLVNSAFYGRAMRAVQNVFPTKFDSLPRAVTVIGQNQLATLAMGVAVMTHFKDVPDDLLDMRSFWRHSLAVGFLAKLMASGIEQANAERFFAAGLLHDIGRLLLGKNAPQLMTAILGLALSQGIALREAEQRVLGWDHCALGGLLLRKWQYPEALEKMVAQHHAPSPGEQGAEAAIIQLADFLANALEYGSSGERLVPALPGEAWDMLGIPSEELQAVVEKLDLEFENMLATFLS